VRHTPTRIALVLAVALTLTAVAQAAPQPMTRDQIINMATPAVDYSYWWGHGCWRTDGTQHGSCSGSCPSCTHSGSYGADCSGYVAKVWQVPSPSPVETNSHPYSTESFRYSTTHWSQISRDDAQRGDAFVYRNAGNTGGHIVLHDSGDPWGSVWTYEARGCSYGIVHNLRTLSSSYVAIKRDLVDETVTDGTLRGVVFEDKGQGTGDMTTRIPGATVSISGHGSQTASDPDADWSFTLPPGSYTVSASANGYQDNARTCEVAAGTTTWCSIGLFEDECTPNCGLRECGPDPVCGESCGSCTPPETCNALGFCTCTKDCSGRECGPDPVCGESCGRCTPPEVCSDEGQCRCAPDCSGRECGPDPICGVSCGTCPAGSTCTAAGQCTCLPDCTGRECGPDPVCGESCGSCPAGERCHEMGICVCAAECTGRECGPDPNCYESCGECPDGEFCNSSGICEADSACAADCEGRECGLAPTCGKSCGRCAEAQICDDAGQCQAIGENEGKLFGTVLETIEVGTPDEALAPVRDAEVSTDGVAAEHSDEIGYYELLVDPGEHEVTAVLGVFTGTATCSVEGGGHARCNIILAGAGDPGPSKTGGGCAAVRDTDRVALLLLGIGLLLMRLARRS